MAAKNPSNAKNSKGKLDFKYHVSTENSTVYLPDGHSSFIARVQEIFSIAKKGISSNNIPKWAKCCKTMCTKACFRTLAHPESELQDFKTILKLNNINNDKEFFSFMKKELPRNGDWDILLPQINMRHTGANNQPENQPEDPEPANLGIPEEPAHNIELEREEQYKAVAEQNEKLSQEVACLKREINSVKVV